MFPEGWLYTNSKIAYFSSKGPHRYQNLTIQVVNVYPYIIPEIVKLSVNMGF